MSGLSRHIEFDKLHNMRDLGGMAVSDGRRIRSGMLFRCGHLAELSDGDIKKLESLADTVVDLRTDGEREEKPDIKFAGAEFFNIPIMDSLTAGITREEAADKDVFFRLMFKPLEAKEYMCRMYRTFAESEFARSQYAKLLKILLLERKKGILWHCTAGKDRAGIASVIVEEILGAPRDVIVKDYLTTNIYLKEDYIFLTAMLKRMAGTESETADEALYYMFGAEEAYINAFYASVEKLFGSIDNYLHEGLSLSDRDIDLLKERYLE